MSEDVAYTVSLTTVSAADTLEQIAGGELLERNFPDSEELWSFVPAWVLSTLLVALVPEAPDGQPDPTTRVAKVWEGVADTGTAWVIDSGDLDGVEDGHFVRLERRPRPDRGVAV